MGVLVCGCVRCFRLLLYFIVVLVWNVLYVFRKKTNIRILVNINCSSAQSTVAPPPHPPLVEAQRNTSYYYYQFRGPSIV